MNPNEELMESIGPYEDMCTEESLDIHCRGFTEKSGRFSEKFYFGEHMLLGDLLSLQLADGTGATAKEQQLKLPNGLALTYGQIVALAGDVYGTNEPISDAETETDRQLRFIKAYETLANDTERTPSEVKQVLDIGQVEVDAVNKALKEGKQPSEALNELGNSVDEKLDKATTGRPNGLPSYLSLALINFDHFGEDAEIAYNTGHSMALQHAISEDGDLLQAYAINSFADHYLQDRFSAGHLRVPRRLLHGGSTYLADYCTKLMHDEDSAIGLNVSNLNGDTWDIYGDQRLFDDVSFRNREICVKALQASADEIYWAWRYKTKPTEFKAWNYAPTLESARTNQLLAPLFVTSPPDSAVPLQRRSDIYNRKEHEFIDDWTYVGTIFKCKWSGLWNYPMQLDGVN